MRFVDLTGVMYLCSFALVLLVWSSVMNTLVSLPHYYLRVVGLEG